MNAPTSHLDQLEEASTILSTAIAIAASAAVETNNSQVSGAHYLIEHAKTLLDSVVGDMIKGATTEAG